MTPTCQGRAHRTGTLGHDTGAAAWLIESSCYRCGLEERRRLCAGRVAHVRSNGLPMQCSACGATQPALELFWHTITPLADSVAPTPDYRLRILDAAMTEGPAAPTVAPGGVDASRVDARRFAAGRETPALVEQYLRELRSRACTPKTIEVRLSTLRTFAHWLPVPLELATRAQLVEWLATPGWAPLTRRGYRTTLTSFYAWLVETGAIVVSPAPSGRVKVPYVEPDPLTTEQVQQLLSSGIRTRTRLMVLLAAYQGMRASEIAATHTGDVDLIASTIRIPNGKGGTDLRRPLHSLVAEHLDAMRAPEGYLFPGMPGREHVSGQSVSTTLSQALRRAGIVGHRPHQLRAWHATELVRLGTDAVTIQHSMRHASLGTLHKYIRPDAADVAGAMEQLPRVDLPRTGRRR